MLVDGKHMFLSRSPSWDSTGKSCAPFVTLSHSSATAEQREGGTEHARKILSAARPTVSGGTRKIDPGNCCGSPTTTTANLYAAAQKRVLVARS